MGLLEEPLLVHLDPLDPRIEPLAEPPPEWGRLAGFVAGTATLFAIACIGYEHWAGLAAHLAFSPVTAALRPVDGRTVLAGMQAAAVFWILVALTAPHAARLWRGLGQAVTRDDLRQALFTLAALYTLGFVPVPWHLGVGYTEMSLVPFAQESWGLHRRILLPALASFAHLDGRLYPLFQLLLVFATLALLRAFLRRHDCVPDLPSFLALATTSFIFHNFQFPGYPDIAIVGLALVMLTVRLPPLGLALLMVLGLLAHEALAFAVLGPLVLWLPRRSWPVVALPFALYLGAWAAGFGFDVLHGWHAQVDYQGHSGPELLLARPATVLFGMLAANKLLWLVVAAHLAAAWRRHGEAVTRPRAGGAALRLTLPVVAALALCVPSYDTSRMAGMGFVTLVLAFVALWPRLRAGAGRKLLLASLLLPSVYVSPFIERTLGVVWSPGLYLLWPMAATGTLHPPVAVITAATDPRP